VDETDPHARGGPDFFERQRLAASGARALGWLSELASNAGQYPPAHPFVLSAAERLLLSCEEILSDRAEAIFSFEPGEAWLAGVPCFLDERTLEVIEGLIRNGIRSIAVRQGVTRSEVLSFVLLIAGPESGIGAGSWSHVLLHQQGIGHIRIGDAPLSRLSGDLTETEIAEGATVHGRVRTLVRELLRAPRTRSAVDGPAVSAAVQLLIAGIVANRDAMIAACWEGGDEEYLVVHSVNVAVLSIGLGHFLSMPAEALAVLGCAGLLHDIGKSAPPPEAACSAGPLSEEHRRRLERHPVEGALILGAAPGIDAAAVTAAYEHHRPYASGAGAVDVVPHPVSRIVAIADALEGLTALRVRVGIPMSPADAVRLMLDEQRKRFDPVILKAFIAMVGVFPPGTELSLDTGERGIVVGRGGDPSRPRVRLVDDAGPGQVVSLAERVAGRYRRSPSLAGPRSAGS
jgi:HD superfamily phosphohydrolase YqeK